MVTRRVEPVFAAIAMVDSDIERRGSIQGDRGETRGWGVGIESFWGEGWKPRARGQKPEVRDQRSERTNLTCLLTSGFCLLAPGFCPRLPPQTSSNVQHTDDHQQRNRRVDARATGDSR